MLNAMVLYAQMFVGTPYIWGGNGPYFDCSGFAQEVLASIGQDPKGDQTAQSLYENLTLKNWPSQLGSGSVLFYGTSRKRITHVAIAIDAHTMIEAAGGDSSTTSIAEATKKGAMVRIRPIRKNFVAVLKPIS